MPLEEGRRRVVIEGVKPQVDGGRFAIKRAVGDRILVEADVFADGHDILVCSLLYRTPDELAWNEVRMEALGNDRWRAAFTVAKLGRYLYSIQGWIDHFHTWRRDLEKKRDAGLDVSLELLMGAALVEAAAGRAQTADVEALKKLAEQLRGKKSLAERIGVGLDTQLLMLMDRYPDRLLGTTSEPELAVTVDPVLARCGAWYEMFPRSTSTTPDVHGTFADCEARLDYVSELGFDVIYLPPIHPIGDAFRKGKNNAVSAEPGDAGSPWAIGSSEGGHKAIHKQLGTLAEFRRFVDKARERGIEVALDVALQCSPDHPYVREHPDWFKARPDGTIQYAENPPKKYQDIYPFNFETDDWRALWQELASIFLYWSEQGVHVFRVDNPHTKPFPFWQWLIGEVKQKYPETIFLSEAFTRPKIMYNLAKLGFSQSYTYFTWRTNKAELIEYFRELTKTDVRETFRPNLWPNTPDILPEHLHTGNRAVFTSRYILAATLGANCGIYGPAYELCEHEPREPRGEEYLDSEKYQLRHWNLNAATSLRTLIARVNRIRHEQPALQSDWSLEFHPVDSDQLLCYSKRTEDRSSIILVVVNLDPNAAHNGWLELPLSEFWMDANQSYEVIDLLNDQHYRWQGPRTYVELHPETAVAHIFQIRR